MFKVGDRVVTLDVKIRTEESNRLYANRIGEIVDISFPFGLCASYRVKFDKPFYDHGYLVEWHYYYDYQNGLEKIA